MDSWGGEILTTAQGIAWLPYIDTGWFFNPSPPVQFSTEMKKELLCLEICHLRWPLFGALAFFSFWYWKKKGKLKNHLAGKNTHENRNFETRWCKKSRRWGGKNADPDWDYCSPQVTSSAELVKKWFNKYKKRKKWPTPFKKDNTKQEYKVCYGHCYAKAIAGIYLDPQDTGLFSLDLDILCFVVHPLHWSL